MEALVELAMQFIILTAKSWIKSAFFKLLGQKKARVPTASIDDIRILHHSANFIVVDKRYDILINSDDPNDKVNSPTVLKRSH